MKTLAKIDGSIVVNIEAIDDWRCTNDNGEIDPEVARNHLIKTGFNPDEYVLYMPETHINPPAKGSTYDSVNNKFISIQRFPSWVLNNTTWQWDPPISYPADAKAVGGDVNYVWDESAYQADSADPKTQGFVQVVNGK